MRTLVLVSLLAAVLAAGCASGGGSSGTTSGRTPATPSSGLRPEDIKPVTEPTHVAWMSFKEVRTRDGKPATQELHLINVAHPDARKPIPLDKMMKVLTNEQMGLLLALMDEKGFSKHARAGLTPERVRRDLSNGLVVVERGGATRGLLFEKGQSATRSEVPEAYIWSKKFVTEFFNKADQPQVYTSDQERVLEIDRRLPSPVRR